MNRETFLDLIPAYALDALDADERAAFEAHLANDAEAQKLLAEYQALTDSLILITPAQAAPAHLQTDLRKRLAAQRKTDAPKMTILPPPEAKPKLRRNRTAAGLVALAAMLVVIIGAIWFLTRSQQPSSPQDIFNRLSAQADAISVAVVPDPTQSEISGMMVAAPDGREAVIRVDNLPALSSDQTFQLWLINAENGVHSGGLFKATQSEATYILLPLESPVQEYQAFAVSIEPEGGSPFADQPTTTPIFAVPIAT